MRRRGGRLQPAVTGFALASKTSYLRRMKYLLLLFILTADLAYAQISAPGSRPLLLGLTGVYQPGLQHIGGELEVGVMYIWTYLISVWI